MASKRQDRSRLVSLLSAADNAPTWSEASDLYRQAADERERLWRARVEASTVEHPAETPGESGSKKDG